MILSAWCFRNTFDFETPDVRVFYLALWLRLLIVWCVRCFGVGFSSRDVNLGVILLHIACILL